MLNLKFKLSLTLKEKLCLVLHVFRENNVPDDVFWYMVNPLFKTNRNDVYVWRDNKFESIFVYEYNFNVVIKLDNYIFGDVLSNELSNEHFKFGNSDYMNSYSLENATILISRKIIDDTMPLYLMIIFCAGIINVYVCFSEIAKNEMIKDVDETYITNIITDNVKYLYEGYRNNTSKGLKYKIGIDRNDLKKLKKFIH